MNVQDYLGLILQSEEEYLESAKRAWFKAPPEGKSTEAKVWVSLADENLELLNGAGSSVFAIVANLIASPAWVDRIHEQGGWILQVGGEVRSDLDWTSAGVSGGMVLPSKPIPSNTIAEIHTHPWGSGPTISLEMFQGSFTYMQPDPGWSALGGSDGPEKPDIVAYVLSNSEDLSNPPRPVTLYRFWWRIRVDCNGRADRAQLTDPETMNV